MERFIKFFLCVLALLVLVQLITYEIFSYDAMPKTTVNFLPQYTHFQKGTVFEFACIDKRSWDLLTDEHKRILDAELGKHFQVIYHSEDEIPQTQIKYMNVEYKGESKRLLTGLDGALLRWEIKESGYFWFKAYYSDFEGNQAAMRRDAIFVWFLFKWIHVYSSDEWIS